MLRIIRKVNTNLLVPVMRLTGFRFSKLYRYEATTYHQVIYKLVDTVAANIQAEGVKTIAKR